ncbi:non-ribosomal peptide synthetase [Veronia pacifica]|uniref:Carrier domain-containing protein n=1 Tax=Veronia pacifica TaxID=1080227 RepID=A0A1C3EMA2_9GAMM|nr:non-ribosomal peptide synthetase [Veronia pacifica]ODA34383.1 hypothetical protein A8L45_06570 [Veronia pacifica]
MSQLSKDQQQLMARLLKNKGVELTKTESSDNYVITPDQENRFEPYPLTDIQQGYLLGRNQHFLLGNVASHAYLEFSIEELNVERYQQAWQKVIARHDMLRTVVFNNGTQQTLSQVPHFDIDVHDFRDLDPAATEKALLDLRATLSHQVLDASRWPLFDIHVSLIDEQRQRIHWSFDAIVSDVYSNFIFQEEIYRCYYDDSVELSPLSLSFRDYVLVLRDQQSGTAYQQAEKYWQERIKTLPAAPLLPLKKELADISKPRFERLYHRLPANEWRSIKQQAKKHGVTTTVVLLNVFSHVLARWCRESRFTLNMTLFNRQPWHSEMDQIVGDFTATMLLAVEALADGDDAGFKARAKRIQSRFLDDLEQRAFSGMQVLQQWSSVSEGQQLAPIVFTSALTVGDVSEQLDTTKKQLGEMDFSITQTPQVLLDHQVYEEAGGLCIHWDHVPEAFPSGLLDTMFASYTDILQQLAEAKIDWDSPLHIYLPTAQREERKRYNQTNNEKINDAAQTFLFQPFNQQVLKQPDAIAVVASDMQLSYQELAQRAYDLNLTLQARGVKAGDKIAVVLPKGWRQVVAVLGILAAGAAYVPIDPDLPSSRVSWLLQEAECRFAITLADFQSADWPDTTGKIHIDATPVVENPDALCFWPTKQAPDALAYIIYTSGSTGKPKGVMMSHNAVVNTLMAVNEGFQIGPEDSVFGLSALNFDLSVYDIFGTLAAGATLVLPDAGHERDPQHWLACLSKSPCTVWNTVPALLQMLLESLPQNQSLPSFKTVMLSGDWIPLDMPEKISRACPQANLFSLGGATEAAIWSIYYPVTNVDKTWRSVPYGLPMANQTFFVLDDAFQSCPDWVTGDLYIGGVGLAQRYWRDDEKTRSRFVRHPQTGERLYKTGDLGCFHPSSDDSPGYIEFQGREDQQIKLGGHRIELGEIETLLNSHPAVKQAVTSLVGDTSLKSGNQQRLVAYILTEENHIDKAQLQQFLAEQLPRYMLPSAYIAIDSIPLNNNGKVNRKALPIPDFTAERKAAYVAPASDMERTIQGVIAGRLLTPELSVTENLFDLGASSLDIVAIHKVLEDQLKLTISVLDLFEKPTIRLLAESLDDQGKEGLSLMEQARKDIQSRRRRTSRPAKGETPQHGETA